MELDGMVPSSFPLQTGSNRCFFTSSDSEWLSFQRYWGAKLETRLDEVLRDRLSRQHAATALADSRVLPAFGEVSASWRSKELQGDPEAIGDGLKSRS